MQFCLWLFNFELKRHPSFCFIFRNLCYALNTASATWCIFHLCDFVWHKLSMLWINISIVWAQNFASLSQLLWIHTWFFCMGGWPLLLLCTIVVCLPNLLQQSVWLLVKLSCDVVKHWRWLCLQANSHWYWPLDLSLGTLIGFGLQRWQMNRQTMNEWCFVKAH